MDTAGHQQHELLTVDQFTQKHRAFKAGGLRWLIFNEKQNGLAVSGAVVRIGRRVLLDEAKFFAWIERQQVARVAA